MSLLGYGSFGLPPLASIYQTYFIQGFENMRMPCELGILVGDDGVFSMRVVGEGFMVLD